MNFEFFADQFQQLILSLQNNLITTLFCLGIFWCIHFVNVLLDYRLNILGIWPRTIYGLPGIFFNVFLHGNWTHLFFNSIPLFLLIQLMLTMGKHLFLVISLKITLIAGFLTWLMGRKGIHVGASGLIMGYWSYLIAYSYHHFSVQTIVLALICLYYLGGLFSHIFPAEKGVSWEGHLFGFIAGIAVALFN